MIEIIKKIIDWAENEPEIRALILEGSMVSGKKTDELSDYDLNFFVTDYTKYINCNEWLYSFDEVVIYQKPDFTFKKWYIPSRLVVYKHSPRVDFSFWNIDILKQFVDIQRLPDFYKNGYKVFVDKDDIASKLPQPSQDGYAIVKPSKDEVLKNIYDFWYEAYCVAKYCHRGNLFFAKMLENGYFKKFLLQMVIWYESANTEWNRTDIHTEGKNLESVLAKEQMEKISSCFSGYSKDDILASIKVTTTFFKKYSMNVCHNLDIEYPLKRIQGIQEYINKILT
ncbi:MAG: aminoglycoside 6-adenylyltransferase [Candidatus Cloacimonetes bacterium]|nr:aminoglycoside 6-adenylyltransferase [Candidatus Cloacimonadota bacterium]